MDIDADKASKFGEFHRPQTTRYLGALTQPHDQGINSRVTTGHLGERISIE